MDQKRLDEIRARCEAATPGPWGSIVGGDDFASVYTDDYDVWIARLNPDGDSRRNGTAKDAEFIAHARTDIPDLLAEVQRQDKLIQLIRTAFGVLPDTMLTDEKYLLDYLIRHSDLEGWLERMRWHVRKVEEQHAVLERLSAERDALLCDVGENPCRVCKHEGKPGDPTPERCWLGEDNCFEWRGPQPKPEHQED